MEEIRGKHPTRDGVAASSSIHVHARSAAAAALVQPPPLLPLPCSRDWERNDDSMRNFAPAADGARVDTSARAHTRWRPKAAGPAVRKRMERYTT